MMKKLHAGPIEMIYENGFLRRMTYRGEEVLRMIYFALRDHNWNTIALQIENESVKTGNDGFEITCDCVNADGGVRIMEWKAKITGQSDGVITFELHGNVTSDFRRNRAGFCVLHPLDVSGRLCELVHDNGTSSKLPFPVDVAPYDPFKNIKSMTWESSGQRFTLGFEGDLFETEDQRNWGDASFKTFCTPLDKPFPMQLKKGDTVFQKIRFSPEGKLQPAAPSEDRVVLQSTGRLGALPMLGVSASTEVDRIPEQAIPLIRALRLHHYRIDIHPSSDRFSAEFSRDYENAHALGLPLEVALHLTENFAEELEAFRVICLQNKVRLRKVLLLQTGSVVTPQQIIDKAPELKTAFPRVAFGGGTNYNFNEINKNRFVATNLDYISFSMDPQEHAFDDLTILENSGSLEYLVASAKTIYGATMPVHISPLTLRKRFNPYATNPSDLLIDEEKKADPRQKQALGAHWTFGALSSLARGMATAVTLYQTVGNQGIIGLNAEKYPLYDTIAMLAPYQGKPAEILASSDPFAVKAMLLDKKLLVIANATGEDKRVTWDGKEFVLSPWQIMATKN